MSKNERYTEAQKILLKFCSDNLSDCEKDVLDRALMPRKSYQPQSIEEGFALALEILGREKYNAMLDLMQAIRGHCGDDVIEEWGRGDSINELYYRFKDGGVPLCYIGISYRELSFIVTFGEKECERFERERDTFPRDSIQWAYDIAGDNRGRKYIMFGELGSETYPYFFRLIDYKLKPRVKK